MYNELKKLLSEATITVTKSRGKEEITFSFGEVKVEKPIQQKVDEAAKAVDKAMTKKETPEPGEIISGNGNEPIMDLVESASKSIKPETAEAIAETKEELTDKEAEALGDETRKELGFNEISKDIPKEVERTPAQKERVSKLINLGFVEKEDQFIRGGLGVGTVMILGCTSAEFNKHYSDLETRINNSTKAAEKPTKSFSDFQAENVEFKEPVIEATKEEPVVETPKPAPMPKPAAIAPVPVVEKSLEEMFNELISAFTEAGYDTSAVKKEDYKTKDSVNQMFEWLKVNPLQQV